MDDLLEEAKAHAAEVVKEIRTDYTDQQISQTLRPSELLPLDSILSKSVRTRVYVPLGRGIII